MTIVKMDWSILENNDMLTKHEEGVLSLALLQSSQELLDLDKKGFSVSKNVFSAPVFSILRKNGAEDIIKKIEDRLERPLQYQDIAHISLIGSDLTEALDFVKLSDSRGSGQFLSLARVFSQKALEAVLDSSLSAWVKQNYTALIGEYDGQRWLRQVLQDYHNWLDEQDLTDTEKKYLLNIDLNVDDLVQYRGSDITLSNATKDIVAMGVAKQQQAETIAQDDLLTQGLQISKTIRISNVLSWAYQAYVDQLSEEEKQKHNKIVDEVSLRDNTKKFLAYLQDSNVNRDIVSSLVEMYENKNDITKCSEKTQDRYVQEYKTQRENSDWYKAMMDFFNANDIDENQTSWKINTLLFEDLLNWKKKERSIDVGWKEFSFSVELISWEWQAAESEIEYWDRPLPIKVVLSDGTVLQTQWENAQSFQTIVALLSMIAMGNSFSKEEIQEDINELESEQFSQEQALSPKLQQIVEKKAKYSFSREQVNNNLMTISDDERLQKAEKILWRELNAEQKKAILDADLVGYYKNKEDAPKDKQDELVFVPAFGLWAEKGDDDNYARWWHYTVHQKGEKLAILQKWGLSREDAKLLMFAWIAGKLSRDDEISFSQKTISSLEEQLEVIKKKIEIAETTGHIEWAKTTIDVADIEWKLRDVQTTIQNKKEDRAKLVERSKKYWISPAEKTHYETEVAKVEVDLKDLHKQEVDLEKQLKPINVYTKNQNDRLTQLRNKLDDEKNNLTDLQNQKDVYKSIEDYEWVDDFDRVSKRIAQIDEELKEDRLRVNAPGLSAEQKQAIRRSIDDLEQEKKDLEAAKKEMEMRWLSEDIDKSNESIQGLKNIWNTIKWEKISVPAVGTSLFVRDWIWDWYFPSEINSEVGNWIEFRVKDVNPTTGHISFTIHWVFKPLMDEKGETLQEWKTIGPMSPNELKEKFVQWGFDQVYKLKTKSSVKDWWLHMKSADIDFAWSLWLDNKHQAWLSDMRSQMDFASFHKINMENTVEGWEKSEEIKYFWADSEVYDEAKWTYNKYRLWYELEKTSGNEVVLNETMINSDWKEIVRKHSFTPQGFFFFAAENNLRPYTQTDVDNINAKAPNPKWAGKNFIDDEIPSPHNPPEAIVRKFAEKRGLFGLKWWSIAAISAFMKRFKADGIKKYLDERQKANDALVWNTLMLWGTMTWLANAKIPAVSEIVASMNENLKNELMSGKTDKIKKFKEEAGNIWDSWPFGQSIAIMKTFFTGEFWKNEITPDRFLYAQKNPLKVAWYFLWCCENGWPYSKALQPFNGSGAWVKLILGETYQKQYLKEREEMNKKIQILPHDSEERIRLQDLYAKQDLWFLQQFGIDQKVDWSSPWKKLYWEAFFSKMLWWAELAWNSQKALSANESDISDAKLFDPLLTDFYAHATSWRGSCVAMLRKMASKVQGNERYYYDWSGAMLFSILSWALKYNFVEEWKQWYVSAARQYAFVPWLYAQDGDGDIQLMRLIDIIAKHTWVTPLSSHSVDGKKFVVWDMTTPDWTRSSQAWANKTVMQSWIRMPWNKTREVIDTLMSPEKLLDILEKEKKAAWNVDVEQDKLNNYNVVRDYLDNKFMDTEESSMSRVENLSRSIIFTKHIWSFSPALVDRLMKVTGSWFPSATADIWPILWRKLWSSIDEMIRSGMTKEKFMFLLKRFVQYFGNKLTPEYQQLLIAGIKYRDMWAINMAVSWSFDKKQLWWNLHPDVARTLKSFEIAFKQWGEIFSKNTNWLNTFEWIDSWSDVKRSYDNVSEQSLRDKVTAKKNQARKNSLMWFDASDFSDFYYWMTG